jgi:hypothetical protein
MENDLEDGQLNFTSMVLYVDTQHNHKKSQTQHKTLGAFGYNIFPAYKSNATVSMAQSNPNFISMYY